MAQLEKLCRQLGVLATTKPEDIEKPYGMRTKTFEQLKKRYATHQKITVNRTKYVMMRWYQSRYRR